MRYKKQSFIKSFLNALTGIKFALVSERNLKVQITIMLLVILSGFFLGLSSMEWAIIALTSALVITAEMINTAIEITVDMVCKDKYNDFAKNAKDVAAGAVLTVSIGSLVVGLIIILPKIINILR